ncbi:hypothetical protein [Burkholderia sp. WTPI3]|uniref:hypothetical protein n=1 Tax=Burkholderia sp. WTPI3 TaxID=2822167 RepID=UPI001F36273F|nr:hypothetical protein [Burkholderia sp. WTPI3]
MKVLRVVVGVAILGMTSGVFCPIEALSQSMKRNIAVGGVDGFEALADPSNSAALRSTGRVSLYIHKYIWDNTNPDLHKTVGSVFDGTGPAVIEVGETSLPQVYWSKLNEQFKSAGIFPGAAYVNAPKVMQSSLTLPKWKSYVDVARSYGVKIVAPVRTPNMNEWETSNFSDGKWDSVREMAKYGGGLVVDSPPYYFLARPEGYRKFVEDEIIWAKEQGIQAILIISPPYNGGDFLKPTEQMIALLRKDGALPTNYVVENYRSKPPVGFKNVIGSERDPMTVLGVAMWLARNVKGG